MGDTEKMLGGCQDNIKVIREPYHDDWRWMELVQDYVQWQALVLMCCTFRSYYQTVMF
jgi:hypothetical protein